MNAWRANERGFTLLELLTAVVIVAVLASVAVVAYTRHIKRTRVVDAHQLLGQIQMRQESYFEVHRSYCYASGGTDDASYHPPLAGGFVPKTWNPPAGFNDLRLRVDKGHSYFSYLVVAGVPPNFAHIGQAAALGIPAGNPWYYAIARGDMDNNGTDYTELRVTSHRSEIVTIGEGK